MQLGWKCSKSVRTNNNPDEASDGMVEKRCQEQDVRRISREHKTQPRMLSYCNTLLHFSKFRDVK
jgi:hypothetical protein